MSDHTTKALAITQKLVAKAEDLLAPLDDEMRIMKWNPEFQKIMWDAVHQAVVKRMVKLSREPAAHEEAAR